MEKQYSEINFKDLEKIAPTKELKIKMVELRQELKDFNMVLDVVSTTGAISSLINASLTNFNILLCISDIGLSLGV